MKKIPMLEKFAAQSLVYVDTGLDDGKELIFSKEKFAELIAKECAGVAEVSMPVNSHPDDRLKVKNSVLKHFGVE
jgi:hypothetical protein